MKLLSRKLTGGPGDDILEMFVNLDAMSVPEALVHSIGILEGPAVVLAAVFGGACRSSTAAVI